MAVTSIASASALVSVEGYVAGPTGDAIYETSCSQKSFGLVASAECEAFGIQSQGFLASADASFSGIHGVSSFFGNLSDYDPERNYTGYSYVRAESNYVERLFHPGSGYIEVVSYWDMMGGDFAYFAINGQDALSYDETNTVLIPVNFKDKIWYTMFGEIRIWDTDDTQSFSIDLRSIRYLDSNMNEITDLNFTPEPSTYALLGPALGLLFWRRRSPKRS